MRLLNPFRRQPTYIVRASSSVPEFDMTAFMKTVKLPQVAWDFPNAYRLVSAIYFAVNLLMDGVASTPLRFFTESDNGEKTYLKPRPGNVAGLWSTANGEDTGRDLIAGIVGSRKIFGTAYLFFEDFGSGQVQGLYLLNPLAVEIIPGKNRTIAGWKVKDGAKTIEFKREQIEHFPMFDSRLNRMPVSPLEPLTVEYEAMYDAMRVIRNLAKNSFVPPGFFSTKGSLGDDVRKRLGRQIRRMLDRLMKRQNDAMILPGDLEFKGAAVTLADMQLTELDLLILHKVLRVYRITPMYAGINEGSGMNSDTVKASRGLFHELAREPECSSISSVMNERVLPRLGAKGTRCEFDFSKILAVQEQRIDAATKIVTLTGGPILTRNEGREWIAMIPIDEPGADELLQPMAMLTAEDRDDMAAASTDAGTDAAAAGEKKGAAEPKRLLSRLEMHRDRRAHLRVRNQRSLARHEREMRKGWRRVFNRQQVRVKARVREQFEGRLIDVADANGNVSKFRMPPELRALNLDDLLRDDAGDERIIRRLIRAIVEQQGSAALAEISLELAFTMTGELKRWIEDNSARSIRETSETTRARLRSSLGEGVEKNEGLGELIARVDSVFDGRRGNVATIARTETAGAYNFATIEGWDQSGEVESKEWLSSHDDAVRESHRDADGQVVSLSDSFLVDGESVEFPGDPSVSPENRCNCRCTVLPVLRQRIFIPKPIRERMNGHTNGNGKHTLEEWLVGVKK